MSRASVSTKSALGYLHGRGHELARGLDHNSRDGKTCPCTHRRPLPGHDQDGRSAPPRGTSIVPSWQRPVAASLPTARYGRGPSTSQHRRPLIKMRQIDRKTSTTDSHFAEQSIAVKSLLPAFPAGSAETCPMKTGRRTPWERSTGQAPEGRVEAKAPRCRKGRRMDL